MALQSDCVIDKRRMKDTFLKSLRSSILHTMGSFWARIERASFQELERYALSLTNLQWGSSSSEKLKPERKYYHYGKGAFNVESTSSLEQIFAASLDSDLGSRLLAVPEALSAAARLTMDQTSSASRDSVNSLQVCLDHAKPALKCLRIARAEEFLRKSNFNLSENPRQQKNRRKFEVPETNLTPEK